MPMKEVLKKIREQAVRVVEKQIRENRRNVNVLLIMLLSHLYALEHISETLMLTLEEIEEKRKNP